MCSDILLPMTSTSLIICINYVGEGRLGFSNPICKKHLVLKIPKEQYLVTSKFKHGYVLGID